jgi:hypothetical protein
VLELVQAPPRRPARAPSHRRRAANLDGHTLHGCAVAMPWEWRQANAFDEQQRLRIAARQSGHTANKSGGQRPKNV